jgi:hypothetical protein
LVDVSAGGDVFSRDAGAAGNGTETAGGTPPGFAAWLFPGMLLTAQLMSAPIIAIAAITVMMLAMEYNFGWRRSNFLMADSFPWLMRTADVFFSMNCFPVA